MGLEEDFLLEFDAILGFCVEFSEDGGVCSDGPLKAWHILAPDELNVSNGETPKYGDAWCQIKTEASTEALCSSDLCIKLR